MALSLGIKNGSKIAIDQHLLEVRRTIPPNLIVVTVDGGDEQVISDQSKTTILPDVAIFSGIGGSGGGNRLAFEAPRSVVIKRVQ